MEMCNKFLFINHSLKIGGIEKWVVEQIKNAKKHNIEVIWLVNGSGDIEEGWKDFIRKNVKIVTYKRQGKTKLSFDKNAFNNGDVITALSFGMVDYYHLLLFKEALPKIDIRCYYMIPHFRNPRYYYEEYFKNDSFQYKIAKIISKLLYKKCNEQGGLLFFGKRHSDEIVRRYQLSLNDTEKRTDRITELSKEFDEEFARIRAKRKPFTIITCGRFEFPHKAYMFGLINAYTHLKESNPDVKLIIIGYGEGEQQLKNAVNRLPYAVQKDILFTGAVVPEELNQYFDQAHVNISVAGGVNAGARTGLVSIPARHYCYDCEVYGYLPNSKTCTLLDTPGENVEKYLNELITMNDDQYINLCRLSYDTYAVTDSEERDEMWIYHVPNNCKNVRSFIRLYCVSEIIINGFIKINRLFKRS